MKEFNLNIKIEVGEVFHKIAEALLGLVQLGNLGEVAARKDRPGPSNADAEQRDTILCRCSVCQEPLIDDPNNVGAAICPNGHSGAPEQTEEQSPPETETTTTQSGVELADGIPWDARIHSSNKKKYSKPPYKWMRKRGLHETVEAEVEAELRALMAAAPPPPPETPPATDAPKITTFVELVQALGANQIGHDVTDPILAKYGVPSLPLLSSRPDLIPNVVADLRAQGSL